MVKTMNGSLLMDAGVLSKTQSSWVNNSPNQARVTNLRQISRRFTYLCAETRIDGGEFRALRGRTRLALPPVG